MWLQGFQRVFLPIPNDLVSSLGFLDPIYPAITVTDLLNDHSTIMCVLQPKKWRYNFNFKFNLPNVNFKQQLRCHHKLIQILIAGVQDHSFDIKMASLVRIYGENCKYCYEQLWLVIEPLLLHFVISQWELVQVLFRLCSQLQKGCLIDPQGEIRYENSTEYQGSQDF